MKEILRSLRRRARSVYQRPSPLAVIDMRLARLAKSCDEYMHTKNIRPSLRILWPPVFNLSKTWWAHDGIWAAAFRLRGVDIVPIMCDRLQSDECMLWAGEWQRSDRPGFRKRRDAYCNKCVKDDISMWVRWGLRPLRLTSFVTAGEIMEAQDDVKEWKAKVADRWKKVKHIF